MIRLLLVLVSILMAGTASAAIPVFSATCPTGINVDADRTGLVRIDGAKAALTKVNDNYYQAEGSGVAIGISLDTDEAPMVSYTGKRGANGVCQAADFIPSGSGAKSSHASSSERAGQGKFDASGNIPCAQYKGQPMGQCSFGVARDGNGSATVVVTRSDGRTRAIFFETGNAIGTDLGQTDGNMSFHATKQADLHMIQAGDERYEIPEAVVFGG